MKQKFKIFWQDRFILTTARFYGLSVLIFAAILIWKWNHLPPELPLFYSLPRGEEQLGSMYSLLLIPGISLTIFVLHTFAGIWIFNEEKLAARILMSSALFISLILLVTFFKIVFLIT